MPAPQFLNISTLKFEVIKKSDLTGGKKLIYFAKYLICKSNLKNSTLNKLKGHRPKICSDEESICDAARDWSQSPVNRSQRQNGQSPSPLAIILAGANTEETNVENNLNEYVLDPDIGELIPVISSLILSTFLTSITTENKELGIFIKYLYFCSFFILVFINDFTLVHHFIRLCILYTSNTRPEKSNKKQKCMKNFVDTITHDKVTELNVLIAECFFGCNFPFPAVESDHFKKFITVLRPAYAEKMPGRKYLSTTLLDKVYDKCLKEVESRVELQSTLLTDVGKIHLLIRSYATFHQQKSRFCGRI